MNLLLRRASGGYSPCVPAECLEAEYLEVEILKWLAGRLPRLDARMPIEPGRSYRYGLFARRAGVHVDFHAHRHFDNFRGLPGHCILSLVVLKQFGANSTPALNLRARRTPRKCARSKVERRYFPPGQSDFPLGQGARKVKPFIEPNAKTTNTAKPRQTSRSR